MCWVCVASPVNSQSKETKWDYQISLRMRSRCSSKLFLSICILLIKLYPPKAEYQTHPSYKSDNHHTSPIYILLITNIFYLLINQFKQMKGNNSLKGFAVIAIVMEIFFAIIYGFHEGYTPTVSYADFNGLIVAIFLIMLLLIGFGLLTTYIKEFSVTGLVLNFIMLAFTVQWYFLVKKFWYSINLADPYNMVKLGDNPYNIRLSGTLHVSNNVNITDMQFFTLGQAVACAIAMFVIMFPLLGKVGPGQALVICFVGNFAYTLNEASFWRLNINDNGFGMRVFLFGSVAGLVASLIIGKLHTKQHQKYYSDYHFQSFAFLGAIFVWILLPWLSVIEQSQVNAVNQVADFRQVAPLNIIYALSASATASFVTSILQRGKISVHDVIFSCFTGAIAYGSSSNVFPNPFPALLIGFLAGVISTLLNSIKKDKVNNEGVIDSLGSYATFLVPSLLGGIYSAILFTTSAYGPDNTNQNVQVLPERTRWSQGGMQMAGVGITIGIAAACGALIGAFSKAMGQKTIQELFNDHAYIDKDSSNQLQQSKEVREQAQTNG